MDITNVANLANPDAAIMETKNIAIEGMTDDECVRKIEKALNENPGIKELRLDRRSGIASITFDTRQTDFPEIHDALLKSGYRPPRTLPE